MDHGRKVGRREELHGVDVGVADAQPEMHNGAVVLLAGTTAGADDRSRLHDVAPSCMHGGEE
jgi:hypothetical protein